MGTPTAQDEAATLIQASQTDEDLLWVPSDEPIVRIEAAPAPHKRKHSNLAEHRLSILAEVQVPYRRLLLSLSILEIVNATHEKLTADSLLVPIASKLDGLLQALIEVPELHIGSIHALMDETMATALDTSCLTAAKAAVELEWLPMYIRASELAQEHENKRSKNAATLVAVVGAICKKFVIPVPSTDHGTDPKDQVKKISSRKRPLETDARPLVAAEVHASSAQKPERASVSRPRRDLKRSSKRSEEFSYAEFSEISDTTSDTAEVSNESDGYGTF